jgi:predicted glycosyltransferase
MRYLFYLGHPAHFHLHKNIIQSLQQGGHQCKILIKKKDVLEDLLRLSGWEYVNINPEGRVENKLSFIKSLLKREIFFFKIARAFKPHAMIGTSAEIGHVGSLLGIPSLVVTSDDTSVVPLFARLAYPMATKIVAPQVCNVGKWEYKKLGYNGNHELAYLHPKYFTPDKKLIPELNPDEKFFLMRFAKLVAHHDAGIQGIDDQLALRICMMLKPYGKVFISSERKLSPELEPFRITINPLYMHHALYFAQAFIGDSQTMSAEAGVLGTPFIRCNDFVGRIGYLNELENTYKLGFGIKPSHTEALLEKIKQLLQIPDLKKEFERRKQRFLDEKEDVVNFYTNAILQNSKKS